MQKLAPTLLFLFFVSAIYSQGYTKAKSIFLEIGGSAGFGSVNYESIFTKKMNSDLLWRVGISAFPIDKNNGFVFVVPVTFGALLGQESNKLELGIGQGISATTKGSFFALTTPVVGYRYQNPTKRFFFRATYTPLISYLLDFQYQNWAGISIGYKLNTKR